MNINAMLNTLQYMGRGMLGIFIVTIVIIALMYLLNLGGNIGGKKDK